MTTWRKIQFLPVVMHWVTSGCRVSVRLYHCQTIVKGPPRTLVGQKGVERAVAFPTWSQAAPLCMFKLRVQRKKMLFWAKWQAPVPPKSRLSQSLSSLLYPKLVRFAILYLPRSFEQLERRANSNAQLVVFMLFQTTSLKWAHLTAGRAH